MKIKQLLLTLLFSLCLTIMQTQNIFADTVTLDSDIPIPSQTVDFSQFTGDFSADCLGSFSIDFCFTIGPIQVGDLVAEDIIWSSTDPKSVIGNGVYGLGSNGIWEGGRSGYVGSDSGSSTSVMRFDFNDAPICAVGGFVNYAPRSGDPFVMKAINSGNAVLEVFDVSNNSPISTSGSNDGAFRGIVRATNDIAALELSGEFDVLDNLKFARCDNGGNVVGGELLPINTTALLLAGVQGISLWMIPVVLSMVGIGLFVVSRKSENS